MILSILPDSTSLLSSSFMNVESGGPNGAKSMPYWAARSAKSGEVARRGVCPSCLSRRPNSIIGWMSPRDPTENIVIRITGFLSFSHRLQRLSPVVVCSCLPIRHRLVPFCRCSILTLNCVCAAPSPGARQLSLLQGWHLQGALTYAPASQQSFPSAHQRLVGLKVWTHHAPLPREKKASPEGLASGHPEQKPLLKY